MKGGTRCTLLAASGRGGPRSLACRVIRAARALASSPTVAGFGSPGEFVVGLGVRESLRLPGADPAAFARPHSAAAAWHAIDRFLGSASGSCVIGYVGFDLFATRHPRLATLPVPWVDLRVPEATYVFRRDGVARVGDDGARWDAWVRDALEREAGPDRAPTPIDLRDHDDQDREGFVSDVERVKAWIHDGVGHRLTLARCVELPGGLDLTSPLAVPRSHAGGESCRSYYFRSPDLELGGTSPELLADVSGGVVRTFKLSGTHPRSTDPAQDRILAHRFERDAKILDEHAQSAAAMAHALKPLGSLVTASPVPLELPNLRHLMTRFEVRLGDGITPARILRSVLCSGADPEDAGLALLARMGAAARGPYYGLFGVVSPSGEPCFSQILRTVFRVKDRCHALVGAAITALSSAQEEYEETRLKLGSIFMTGGGDDD